MIKVKLIEAIKSTTYNDGDHMSTPVILHIEDTLDTATLTKRHLEKNGLEVVICLSGTQGLKMAEEVQPDLILLDVELPDMDGFEVCKQLRKQTSTPIIFLTATNSIAEIQKGLLAGGDDYITKPYSTQDLVGRIHVRLRKNAQPEAPGEEKNSDLDADDLADDSEPHADVIVIMSPQVGLRSVYDDHLAGVIRSLKLTSTRVDRILTDTMTVPEMMAMMYYARLLIVDTTSNAPHVFYALGAAHALGKAMVILAKNRADIPGALKDEKCIIYSEAPLDRQAFEGDLRKTLKQALNMPSGDDTRTI
jgi:CheY-like chemotaxis protein